MAHMNFSAGGKYTRKDKRKKLAAITALLLVVTLLLGGVLAWNDKTQHKTNEFDSSGKKHDIRLIDEFDKPDDWKQGQEIDKKIRVANVGKSSLGFQPVYARIQFMEYMEIGEVLYEYSAVRYMIYTEDGPAGSGQYEGHFIVYPTLAAARYDWGIDRVYAQYTDLATGDSGWLVPTDAGDPDGQYGKKVLINVTTGIATSIIPGVVRASDDAIRDATGTHDAGTNGECLYTIHSFDTGSVYYNNNTGKFAEYIEWILNDASIEYYSDWLANPSLVHTGQFWLVDDTNDEGWVYWMDAIPPDGGVTENFMEAVTLIKQPEGAFYYAIHVEMEGYSLEQLPADWLPPVAQLYKVTGVTVEPSPFVAIGVDGYQLFTATVQGTGSVPQGVVWSISENTSGHLATVTSNGLLRWAYYPSGNYYLTGEHVTVRATSVADPSVYTEVTIGYVDPPTDMPTFGINPHEPDPVEPGGTQQFTAFYASGFAFPPFNNDVTAETTWQVIENKSAGTTISAGGLLTIAPDEKAAYVVVRGVYNGRQSYVRVDINGASGVGGDVIDLSDPNPQGGSGWTYTYNTFTVTGDVTIINSTTTRRVVVQPGANVSITLDDVDINLDGMFAIDLRDANVNLSLSGNNSLASFWSAVHVPEGAVLTIGGSGSLIATGGYGTAIGGTGGGYSDWHIPGDPGENGGTVIINSGTVTAVGINGAGIGGGPGGSGGAGGSVVAPGFNYYGAVGGSGGNGCELTVNGGTVTASSQFGAGIGGGRGGTGGSGTVGGTGGAGGNGGAVTINGGTVTVSSEYSTAIGGGAGGVGGFGYTIAGTGIGRGGAAGNGGTGAVVHIFGGTVTASSTVTTGIGGGAPGIPGDGDNMGGSQGYYGANNTFDVSIPIYQWWSNTTASDPGGLGTSYPPTAYAFSITHKFIKIVSG